jgi:16S rRNA (cytosine1402-N4)-methyltransferase
MGLVAHESVLLEEVCEWLKPASGKVLLDGTLGLGGHARCWLERSAPDGKVIGFDRDLEALTEARRLLEGYGDRALIFHGNFRDCWRTLESAGPLAVDAALLDLGVSSLQLDRPGRGFSFRTEGPLDMRMDQSQTLTAEKIVNEENEKSLQEILWNFGQERYARRIVQRILEVRSCRRIRSTTELENIIFHGVPKAYRYGRIHPATRTFQALRIAVNGELGALDNFLPYATTHLKTGARLAVISFHSLEDRRVKQAFRAAEKERLGKALTRKPILPTEAEMTRNPRSRSAKMRVWESTGDAPL